MTLSNWIETCVRLAICEELDIVIARLQTRRLGCENGMRPGSLESLTTAVTEVARNMVVHAQGGRVSIARERAPEGNAIVVVAEDDGPGIIDVGLAMQDGYSTREGLGLGLPSARRMVDSFVLETAAGRGTTVILKKWIR